MNWATVWAFIRLIPEFIEIARRLMEFKDEIAFELALRSSLKTIGEAFKTKDPVERAKRLNDAFRKS